MASRRMDREMNGPSNKNVVKKNRMQRETTPANQQTRVNQLNRDVVRKSVGNFGSTVQGIKGSNGQGLQLKKKMQQDLNSGQGIQKKAAQNASGISNKRSDLHYSFKQDYESAAKSTTNAPAKQSTATKDRLKKNTDHPVSRNDNRGYSRSGDDYQKQAASNAKKPSDERNDTRGYARSGDGYQKQAARNAPVIKTSERDDSRGYPRSGDISQKQAAKNSSSKPSILNLEKAMNDYAAGKLNVKKVTSTPSSKKSKGSAWDLISKAFNDENTMRKIKNYAGSYKVVDVGLTNAARPINDNPYNSLTELKYNKKKKKTNTTKKNNDTIVALGKKR